MALRNGNFFVSPLTNELLCQTHYLTQTRTSDCAFCKKGITSGDVIEYHDKQYHAKCFVCSLCINPLKTPFNYQGKPYCWECVQRMTN